MFCRHGCGFFGYRVKTGFLTQRRDGAAKMEAFLSNLSFRCVVAPLREKPLCDAVTMPGLWVSSGSGRSPGINENTEE
jgi:hypothetical protein